MKKIIILAILIVVTGIYLYQKQESAVINIDVPIAQEYQAFTTSTPDIEKEIEIIEEVLQRASSSAKASKDRQDDEIVLIDAINLDVPFTSQAPTANWGQPWQDACEEASVLMVDYYYQGTALPGLVETESLLKDMTDWQIENWGDHHNLTMEELAEFVEITFGYQTELIIDLTPDKVKEYLQTGLPVIVPADGHKLNNPYFSNDGPDYHMLVIKGYSEDHFITNDPGTSWGAEFVYTSENLFYSIAEWNQKESQATGPKIGLVLNNN